MDFEKLSAESVKALLKNKDIEVFYYPSIDSTNSEARRLVENGAAGRLLVISDEQTAGRGRQGKSFFSPAKTGIYMSLVLRPELPPEETLSITSAAAVAVCRAIEKLTDKKPEIKWVNDIYLGGRKICGILTEAVTDRGFQKASAVIAGIGINVSTEAFPAEVENGGSLGCEISRAALIAAVADGLCELNGGYPSFIEEYRRRSFLTGKEIAVIKKEKSIPATALGIDGEGGLIVRYSDGKKEVLRSGEISVRTEKRS